MRKYNNGFLFTFTFLAICLLATGVSAQEKESEESSQSASAPMATPEKATPSDDASDDVEQETKLLTIGSDAPALDVEHWIHDGEGQFGQVTEFETGKVYVVEFWATWCGPCIASMPHIVELQKKYADQGVQIVSVSSEPIATIDKFFKREVPGMRVPREEVDEEGDEEEGDEEDKTRPVTYEELTSSYCLTTDPDRSTSDDYMKAAGQNGIPCAFIVGKDSKIEWIGHPMRMDNVLEAVVNDSWDREAFGKEFIEEQLGGKVYYEVVSLLRKQETENALAKINHYLETGTHEASISRMQRLKIQLLLGEDSMRDEAKTYVLELLDAEPSDATLANSVGWSVYRMAESPDFDDDDFLNAVLDRVNKAANALDNTRQESFKPYLLDTAAHLHNALGNVALAIETQKQAIELVEDERGRVRLQKFLDELTAEPEEDSDANAELETQTEDAE
ncbi:Thiol-disulfide oxidoreductase ResA [Novipirellula aureliae]|uniref:Thiol-disulfide oxidoreductase ResA n=1 Tax=Novipirellula aureliae TaxID=2527966 RepID=A0A5C6EF02_9BACT|nr:redoxin domain-containing protein [Novipirellula aureliae]TWU45789.1 Thiol-disulfide oxidoreductase ResA [Novipirellula aureliae]